MLPETPGLRVIRLNREIRDHQEQKEKAVSEQDFDRACRHRDAIDRLRAERERAILEERDA